MCESVREIEVMIVKETKTVDCSTVLLLQFVSFVELCLCNLVSRYT